jgi:predicted DNA-binding ribbon-helix-helix protein
MFTQPVAKAVDLRGRRMSLELDADQWEQLARIARREKMSLDDVLSAIDARRADGETLSLAAAVRVFLIGYRRMVPQEH